MILAVIGTFLLVVCTCQAWFFAVLYFARSRWSRFPAGRAMLYLSLVIAVVLTYVLVLRGPVLFESRGTTRDIGSIAIWGVLALVLGNLDRTLIQAQRQRRSHRRGDGGGARPPD